MKLFLEGLATGAGVTFFLCWFWLGSITAQIKADALKELSKLQGSLTTPKK